MPLPMQGKKLIPGHHHIGRRRIRARAPHRWNSDRALDALDQLGDPAAEKLSTHRLAVGGAARSTVMGRAATRATALEAQDPLVDGHDELLTLHTADLRDRPDTQLIDEPARESHGRFPN